MDLGGNSEATNGSGTTTTRANTPISSLEASTAENSGIPDGLLTTSQFDKPQEKKRAADFELERPEHDLSPTVDDSWLDTWDYRIHRCETCKRPYTGAKRLKQHNVDDNCEKMKPYQVNSKTEKQLEVDKVFELTVDCDLILVNHEVTTAGKKAFGYKVSSHTLSAYSSVFKELFGPTSTSTTAISIRKAFFSGGPPVYYELESINHKSLLIALSILYHRSSDIPEAVQFPILLGIALFTHRYAADEILKSWMGKWKDNLIPNIKKSDYGSWLFIAHIFGYRDLTASISRSLSTCTSWSSAANVLEIPGWASEGSTLLHPDLPRSVIDGLIQLRNLRVDVIRTCLQQEMTKRYVFTTTYCRASANRTECDALMFGRLMRTIELYKLKDHSPIWNKSVELICKELKEITFQSADFGLDLRDITLSESCARCQKGHFSSSNIPHTCIRQEQTSKKVELELRKLKQFSHDKCHWLPTLLLACNNALTRQDCL
ncbi:hypothetical protein BJ508DRAFT_374057 [Ascobolus immersus RN42]|uniref:BTB domain-containing protein n=1 Tax=Ascobolus immersus RN42 TaxID=1160509 RepID=A0A3N4IFX8_ASCIM|nr:hypothetical protein BJ508DRAFT_374057 [Ascobolus immersus RN42]